MSALKPKVATLEIFFEVVELSTQSGQQRRTVGAISGLAFTKLLKIFLRPFLWKVWPNQKKVILKVTKNIWKCHRKLKNYRKNILRSFLNENLETQNRDQNQKLSHQGILTEGKRSVQLTSFHKLV
jgi:hypothetical protein